MRASQAYISYIIASLQRNPGTTTTGPPSPRGTPYPWYTGERRRANQSAGQNASRQIGGMTAGVGVSCRCLFARTAMMDSDFLYTETSYTRRRYGGPVNKRLIHRPSVLSLRGEGGAMPKLTGRYAM